MPAGARRRISLICWLASVILNIFRFLCSEFAVGGINIDEEVAASGLDKQVTHIVSPTVVVVGRLVVVYVRFGFVGLVKGELGRVVLVLEDIEADASRLLPGILCVV